MDRRSLLKKKAQKESERYKEPSRVEVDYNSKNPIFSFYNIPYGKEYCLSRCELEEKAEFAHTLLMISQMQWKNIYSIGRKQLGLEHIPIDQFHTSSFPDIVTPDVEKLMVFTYSHGGRMAGIRENDVFHVLFVGDNLYSH